MPGEISHFTFGGLNLATDARRFRLVPLLLVFAGRFFVYWGILAGRLLRGDDDGARWRGDEDVAVLVNSEGGTGEACAGSEGKGGDGDAEADEGGGDFGAEFHGDGGWMWEEREGRCGS